MVLYKEGKEGIDFELSLWFYMMFPKTKRWNLFILKLDF